LGPGERAFIRTIVELRLFLRGKLDAYKIPTRINVVDRTNFNERFKKIRRKDGATS
jgi:hypothetical protein